MKEMKDLKIERKKRTRQIKCTYCNSKKFVKAGFTRTTRLQVYKCKRCHSKFVPFAKKGRPQKYVPIACTSCGSLNTKYNGGSYKGVPEENQSHIIFCKDCHHSFRTNTPPTLK